MPKHNVSRRTVLQGTATGAVGGIALTGHASADAGPCESEMADLTVYNGTDDSRWVSLTVSEENGSDVAMQQSKRVGSKDFIEIDSLGDSVATHELQASVDDGSEITESISELSVERFMHGYRLEITEDDTFLELEHIDLPADRYAELVRRC